MSATVMARADGTSCHLGGREVLSNVSVEIEAGEIVALVGPNGAGKSTLLAVLAGDQETVSGTVELAGRPMGEWSTPELARQRSVLLQANQVSFGFTVRAVVEMGRMPWAGLSSPAEDAAQVESALTAADVNHLARRPFPQLSGGEKARASLARVLAQDCPVIMLDEPTAALDLAHTESVMNLARTLSRQGRAVIVVLHDLSLAAAYADRICVIRGGTIAATGAPRDVLTPALLREVYDVDAYVMTDPDGELVIQPRRSGSSPPPTHRRRQSL